MAPYVHEHQGLPKQHYGKNGVGSENLLGVSKDSHSAGKPPAAAGSPPAAHPRRDWGGVNGANGSPMLAPTIRVIHIFAPKVIKTDVANFRSTVQRLTGRSKKSSERRSRIKSSGTSASQLQADGITSSASVSASGSLSLHGGGGNHPSFTSQMWDHECSPKEVLQRLVGDACGTTTMELQQEHLVARCNSIDSAYSIDSGSYISGDSCNTMSSHSHELAASSTELDYSPGTDSFSFYPHRETPYALNEIPAPFFGDHQHMMNNIMYQYSSPAGEAMLQPAQARQQQQQQSRDMHHHNVANTMIPYPPPFLDSSLNALGFGDSDMDYMSSAGFACSSVPLTEFASFPPLGSTPPISSSTSATFNDQLFMPPQPCRFSVQPPLIQGTNFFENL